MLSYLVMLFEKFAKNVIEHKSFYAVLSVIIVACLGIALSQALKVNLVIPLFVCGFVFAGMVLWGLIKQLENRDLTGLPNGIKLPLFAVVWGLAILFIASAVIFLSSLFFDKPEFVRQVFQVGDSNGIQEERDISNRDLQPLTAVPYSDLKETFVNPIPTDTWHRMLKDGLVKESGALKANLLILKSNSYKANFRTAKFELHFGGTLPEGFEIKSAWVFFASEREEMSRNLRQVNVEIEGSEYLKFNSPVYENEDMWAFLIYAPDLNKQANKFTLQLD